MEPLADKLNAFKKSTQDFFTGVLRRRDNAARCNPIEILKRLQREAFADLMKLRDRQDKVERMLTFSRTSKGGPFQEDGTHVRGEVDVMGSLFLMDYLDQQSVDAIRRAGIRTGIDAKIIFETKMRQKDILEAEFITSRSSHRDWDDMLETPLSLAKVSYTANMSDWFSVSAIPLGARCRDVAVSIDSQEKGLTDYSSFGPPLLRQIHGSAIGFNVRKSKVAGSLAQFIVDLPSCFGHCFSTFGQIVCLLPASSKLSLFGLHQLPKSRLHPSVGPLTLPLGILRPNRRPQTSTVMPTEASSPSIEACFEENIVTGSVAVMLESELDESTRIRGWVQMRNSDPKHVQWAVSMSDFPEDEIGWGLSLGGLIQGPANWNHCQVEAFLKFNLGKRLTLQPGFTYLVNANNRLPVVMFRSTWSL